MKRSCFRVPPSGVCGENAKWATSNTTTIQERFGGMPLGLPFGSECGIPQDVIWCVTVKRNFKVNYIKYFLYCAQGCGRGSSPGMRARRSLVATRCAVSVIEGR